MINSFTTDVKFSGQYILVRAIEFSAFWYN